MDNKHLTINDILVRRLITAQFPQWKDLVIRPVKNSGWDNRTFHLGDQMLVRMPSAEDYASQVEKEQTWLPKLAPLLPFSIPIPLALGKPADGYPWKWSIYRWLEGEAVSSTQLIDLNQFATDLAQFLIALQKIDSANGPLAGLHSFYRGGLLSTYDAETRQALMILKDKIDVTTATDLWEKALATTWQHSPVWVHGDLSVGNLLLKNGQLSAVIDFGQLAIGDPACDLSIAWTFFKGESRDIFRKMLPLDADTWMRARAWTLWKSLIVVAGLTDWEATETVQHWYIINEVLEEPL